MQLTHKIALAPSAEQDAYFRRAAGCARFVWNNALAEWNRLHAAGEQPTALALKRAFNYPSSKSCSCCGHVLASLPLSLRTWTCPACGVLHDRDQNAATNLRHLAILALPVANRPVTDGTAAAREPDAGGKVTPVRHECVQQAPSGQEEGCAHSCAQP